MLKIFSKKRLKTGIIIIMFVFLFFVLFILSALGGLRFFIPNYFEIAGGPFSEKSYLVLFQDEKQLSPTGGAVTRYGIIKFVNSFYNGLEKKDVPLFLSKESDFSKNIPDAIKAVSLEKSNTNFDGVFAVNISVIDEILKTIGSEKLNNIFFSPLSWREVSDIMVRNLNEKNIQLYFFNNGLQKKIEEKGWGGVWPKPNGDFIAVINSITSENSLNQYINRNIDYRVNLSNARANLTVTLENFSPLNEPSIYNGTLKIYLAPGTVLQKATSQTVPEESADYAIYLTEIYLKPGERKTINYSFILPPGIINNTLYHLDIIKQSGTKGDTYSVIIENPLNHIIKSNDFEIIGNIALWKGFLNKDASLNFFITKTE